MTQTAAARNLLLSALPEAEYKRISKKLTQIPLLFNHNLFEPGDKISHVYFPESGIVSLLSGVDPKCTLEVGLVGNEGIVGLPVFLGVDRADNCAVIQGEGTAHKMSVPDFEQASSRRTVLSQLLKRYVHSRLTQISQSAVCYRFHLIDERLARWLLMIHDRINGDAFPITQKFLSNMVGVRREAVNKAARALQRRGMIDYSRGTLRIADRKALEKAACVCYEIIRNSDDVISNKKTK